METPQGEAKSSCRRQFSPISTKRSQNNNGGVPIHYPNFGRNPKSTTQETETRQTSAKRKCRKQFSPISTKLSKNNNCLVPILYPNFKRNPKARTYRTRTWHTRVKSSCWKQFSPISTKLSQNNNGWCPHQLHKILSQIRKPELTKWRHDTTGLKVCVEDKFLRFQRNSPKTTMVASPSITQILSEIWKPELTKWRHDTTGLKVRAEDNFLRCQRNPKTTNGGVPIHYPNFKRHPKTWTDEMVTPHSGAKCSCRKQLSPISTKLS